MSWDLGLGRGGHWLILLYVNVIREFRGRGTDRAQGLGRGTLLLVQLGLGLEEGRLGLL